MRYRVEAVTVNHNTSRYAELMLRSLLARHRSGVELSVTVLDNASQDETVDLRTYARSRGISFLQSGFTTETAHNSHGEILARFVAEHPSCTHHLFLDADVCFLEDGTVDTMLAELEGTPDAFGIGARMSSDGVIELSEDIWRTNPDIYEARLHPACALVRNTDLFQEVVREVGLSCVNYLWADREEYLDTFKLMTRVMKTHGLRHIISSRMVLHFFNVSYHWELTDRWLPAKAARRDALLEQLRERDG